MFLLSDPFFELPLGSLSNQYLPDCRLERPMNRLKIVPIGCV